MWSRCPRVRLELLVQDARLLRGLVILNVERVLPHAAARRERVDRDADRADEGVVPGLDALGDACPSDVLPGPNHDC